MPAGGPGGGEVGAQKAGTAAAATLDRQMKVMLEDLQSEFDEFRSSSAELEQELERELERVEGRARRSELELRRVEETSKLASARVNREVCACGLRDRPGYVVGGGEAGGPTLVLLVWCCAFERLQACHDRCDTPLLRYRMLIWSGDGFYPGKASLPLHPYPAPLPLRPPTRPANGFRERRSFNGNGSSASFSAPPLYCIPRTQGLSALLLFTIFIFTCTSSSILVIDTRSICHT